MDAGFGAMQLRALRDHMRKLVLIWLRVPEKELEQELRNWPETWATYTRSSQLVRTVIHLLCIVAVRKLGISRRLSCTYTWENTLHQQKCGD